MPRCRYCHALLESDALMVLPEQSTWKTENVALEAALKLQENHVKYAHQEAAAGAAPATLKAEKLVRPTIKTRDGTIEDEEWEYFLHRWNTYKAQANLTVSTKSHLESCLDTEVTMILFGRLGQAGWDQLTEKTLLEEVKNVFVKKRNRMVNWLKLHNLLQGEDQPVQQYVAMLKSIARTCKYTVNCPGDNCDTRVDYSEEMVLDQLVRGLFDSEIQRKVLSCKEENFNLDYVEKIIISEESSKASQKDSKSTTLELPQCLLTRRTSKGFRSKSQLSKAAETVGTAPIKVIMNCH